MTSLRITSIITDVLTRKGPTIRKQKLRIGDIDGKFEISVIYFVRVYTSKNLKSKNHTIQ